MATTIYGFFFTIRFVSKLILCVTRETKRKREYGESDFRQTKSKKVIFDVDLG